MLSRFWRFGFRLLYNEFAFTYDFVSYVVSLGQWRCWQRSVLQFLPPPQAGLVLEIAHGTGDLQVDLLRAGYRTVALDVSFNMGRHARRKLTRCGLTTAFVRADANLLPFQSGSIAALVCTFPTSFIVHPETLSELERVLKQGGRAVIVLTGMLEGNGLVRKLIRNLYRLTGQSDAVLNDDEIGDLFRVPGLTIEVRTVTCDRTVAQLVVLTKASTSAQKQPDHRLDFVRQA